MKATIIRPDGTRIEVEGTPEEIAKTAAPPPHANVMCLCGSTAYSQWCPVHRYPPCVRPYGVYGVKAAHGWAHNNATAANPITSYWYA